jgi:hypothetical protein
MHYDVNREQLLVPAKKIEAFSQREENFMQKMRTGVHATVSGKSCPGKDCSDCNGDS